MRTLFPVVLMFTAALTKTLRILSMFQYGGSLIFEIGSRPLTFFICFPFHQALFLTQPFARFLSRKIVFLTKEYYLLLGNWLFFISMTQFLELNTL